MSSDSRWASGACMTLFSLVGLFIASRATDAALYWTGLLLFLIGAATIFNLIRMAYDEAEGRTSEHHQAVPFMLVLVAVGSVLFHVVSPWWWTPIASNWGYIDDTITITFWITGAVFAAIVLFMAYCVFRFGHRTGRRAVYEPENKKLEWWLTIGTGVGVAAMLAPGLFVWNQFITVPAGASEVEIVGNQWQWSYRFAGEDGRLGASDVRNISADNPLGLSPGDPDGQDDVIVPGGDLHLPLGKPVKLLLRSTDVLHNAYVPEFRAKMDMIPGMVTYYWLTPTRAGRFEIFCAELCGIGHSYMRAAVVVAPESDHRAWLRQQRTFAQLSAPTNRKEAKAAD